MNKQIKEILEQSRVSSKWVNCGEWQKDKISNLFEASEKMGLRVRRTKNDHLLLRCEYGRVAMSMKVPFEHIESYVSKMYAMYLIYLGDTFVLKTRFKDYTNK